MAKKTHVTLSPIENVFPAWDGLTPDERQFVRSNFTAHTFKRNETVYSEGDVPSQMMLLADGKLKVYKEGVGNRTQIIRILKPGNTFGYRAIIANGSYNTNVMAIEPSVVYMLRTDIFLSILQHNNALCYYYLRDLADDLGHSDSRTVNLTQKHIRGRLAETLLLLKNDYGLEENNATINIYLSREDLANYSNMTTSNAIRTLGDFAEEHLIALDGKKIKIIDEEKLLKVSKSG
ncbi:MAG: Crp/Fnr family transcriptional regulator [Prevotellaceae bacterium]|jgi:CRP-like cAMP-binding protein|nr:Crp/Fnr family transcriptional regulator [Prevotellaceae bacterium]